MRTFSVKLIDPFPVSINLTEKNLSQLDKLKYPFNLFESRQPLSDNYTNSGRATETVGTTLQGQQGLSGHFEMALTGRKKVAMSKLMVATNSQIGVCINMARFYVPIKPCPQ